jgi:hypothetical protein
MCIWSVVYKPGFRNFQLSATPSFLYHMLHIFFLVKLKIGKVRPSTYGKYHTDLIFRHLYLFLYSPRPNFLKARIICKTI